MKYLIKIIPCVCLLMLSQSAFAQKSPSIWRYVSADTVLNFKSETTTSYSRVIATMEKDICAFTMFSTNKLSDTVTIYCIHATSGRVDTINIYEEGLRNKMRRHKCVDFDAIAMNGNLLSVSYFKTLLIYKKKDNGSFEKFKEVKIDDLYGTMHFVDDHTLLFSKCYYGQTPSTTLMLYDINRGKTVDEIHPYHNSTLHGFVRFGNPLVDCRNGKILWSNTNEYSFLLYNSKLRRIDSVYCDYEDWTPIADSTFESVGRLDRHLAPNIIDLVCQTYDSLDRIVSAQMLDDAHILFVRKTPKRDMFNYFKIDLWSFKNNHWERTLSDIDDEYINRLDKFIDCPEIDFAHNRTFVIGNKIVSIRKNGCVAQPLGMKYKDYLTQCEDYMAENDYFVQVVIFSHKLFDIK